MIIKHRNAGSSCIAALLWAAFIIMALVAAGCSNFAPPRRVTFLVDTTASALAKRPDMELIVKNTVSGALTRRRSVEIALISYGQTVRTEAGFTPVGEAFEAREFLGVIQEAEVPKEKGTFLVPALQKAARTAKTGDVLVILTDGEFHDTKAELQRALAGLKTAGVSLVVAGPLSSKGGSGEALRDDFEDMLAGTGFSQGYLVLGERDMQVRFGQLQGEVAK